MDRNVFSFFRLLAVSFFLVLASGCTSLQPNKIYTPSAFATIQPKYVDSEVLFTLERQQLQKVDFSNIQATVSIISTGQIVNYSLKGPGTLKIGTIGGTDIPIKIETTARLIYTPGRVILLKER